MVESSIKADARCGLCKTICLKGFRGFTLAEVLITLVIIGVIAAMTIPTLINKTNNHEFVSKLKKVYSTLSNATNQIISEEGSPKEWAANNESLYNAYKKHLQIAKDCGGTGECFTDGNYKYLKGGSRDGFHSRTDIYSVLLNDGVSLTFGWTDGGACTNAASYSNVGSENKCAYMHADINGQKGPNTIGRDIFIFALKENGLYPGGCDEDTHCHSSAQGWGCACQVLKENAMNY